ncbi:MAG TPA: ketoacyl-ACP synthase III [Thermoanaerobaculia bacterium]|nr:ketoacyl-ACP synthase III [Thermoanaerobaculia bacterium]
MTVRSVIAASGCFIPPNRVPNDAFLQSEFWDQKGRKIDKSNGEILAQFQAITGIRERRYASDDMVTSDVAAEAGRAALESSGIDPASLDYIIVAHNFGDVRAGSRRSDLVPSLAARVKNKLRIRNPRPAAFDLIFGCPGWLQGVIQGDALIRAGAARRVMVIGSETLSRVSDPHDRDSLIYADGAGATILEARETADDVGILAHAVRSDSIEQLEMLFMARSYHPDLLGDELFLKMEGRKLYRYALETVAGSIKECLDQVGIGITDVDKILLHQANEKMDEAILDALYDLYGATPPAGVMPMTIGWLGNSSVATLPTLYDLLLRGQIDGQTIGSGDLLVFASVGAGMHINAFVYRMP